MLLKRNEIINGVLLPLTKKRQSAKSHNWCVVTTFIALASFYGGVYLLTPYSGFARALVWADADIKEALERREKESVMFLYEDSILLPLTIESCLECSFLVN